MKIHSVEICHENSFRFDMSWKFIPLRYVMKIDIRAAVNHNSVIGLVKRGYMILKLKIKIEF